MNFKNKFDGVYIKKSCYGLYLNLVVVEIKCFSNFEIYWKQLKGQGETIFHV